VRDDQKIQSVSKALQILCAFDTSAPSLGISELSGSLGFPRSVTHKLVRTLAGAGFLLQDYSTRRYYLGPSILPLATRYLDSKPLFRDAPLILGELTRRTGHTSALGTLEGAEVLFVAVAEGTGLMRAGTKVGDRRPLYATAAGKVLLAALAQEEMERLLGKGPFPQLTPFTVTNLGILRKQLVAVRRAGVAYNLRESYLDASAVAVAVSDPRGAIIASITLILPASVEERRIRGEFTKVVKHYAQRLSARLGPLAQIPIARKEVVGATRRGRIGR